MDLKEFVQSALQQIAEGLVAAHKSDALAKNPNPPACQEVHFDAFLVADALNGVQLANDIKTGTHVTFTVTLKKAA